MRKFEPNKQEYIDIENIIKLFIVELWMFSKFAESEGNIFEDPGSLSSFQKF